MTDYRVGTKLIFITCWGMGVKPFGRVLPRLQARLGKSLGDETGSCWTEWG
jgi:hypothetical protein